MMKKLLFGFCMLFLFSFVAASYGGHGGYDDKRFDSDLYWASDYYKIHSVEVTKVPYYSYYNIKSFEDSFYEKKARRQREFELKKQYELEKKYELMKKSVREERYDVYWDFEVKKKYVKNSYYYDRWRVKEMWRVDDWDGGDWRESRGGYDSDFGVRRGANGCYYSAPSDKLFYIKC